LEKKTKSAEKRVKVIEKEGKRVEKVMRNTHFLSNISYFFSIYCDKGEKVEQVNS
jgi:hypothetical protein